jgi:hypothetical protein
VGRSGFGGSVLPRFHVLRRRRRGAFRAPWV